MRTYMLGGGFGRRLNGDYIVPAALASKALGGKPVKMVMRREDDAAFDSVRSPSLSKLRMAFDGDKKVIAMETAVASGWPTKHHGPAEPPWSHDQPHHAPRHRQKTPPGQMSFAALDLDLDPQDHDEEE